MSDSAEFELVEDDFLLAWRYANGMLSATLQEAFEVRLESDELLADQLIAAVRLSIAAASIVPAPVSPNSQTAAIESRPTAAQGNSRRSAVVKAITTTLACAAVLLLLVNYGPRRTSQSVTSVVVTTPIADTSDAKFRELLQIYASDSLADGLIEAAGESEHQEYSRDAVEIDVPGWLFAALEIGNDDADLPEHSTPQIDDFDDIEIF